MYDSMWERRGEVSIFRGEVIISGEKLLFPGSSYYFRGEVIISDLQCGENLVPGRIKDAPVAVSHAEQRPHALDVLGGQLQADGMNAMKT